MNDLVEPPVQECRFVTSGPDNTGPQGVATWSTWFHELQSINSASYAR